MAVIQPRGSLNKKKFQFQVPVPLLEEYREKKELLESLDQRVDITDDLVKAFKDGIRQMDKRLTELSADTGKSSNEAQSSSAA